MKPSRPSHHTFRGKQYCIRWRAPKDKNNVGECEDPRYKNPRMMIHPDLTGIEKLMTLVDESIHAVAYDLDNDVVLEMSSDISKFLWECGLRFKDET